MSKKIMISEIKRRIKEKHGDLVTIDKSTYSGTHSKARFFDKDYGEFWAVVRTITDGSGCKKRYNEFRKLPLYEVLNRLKNVHKGIIALDVSTYINTRRKATFIDADYGKWNATVSDVLRGFGHPKRDSNNRRVPLTIVKKRLLKIYGDLVTIDESTYIKVSSKAKFVDKEYGEWWAYVSAVLKGCGHFSRGVQKMNNSFIKFHWKTDKKLICQGSWEAKVVDYLNQNKINFEWQPGIFLMPNSKKYRPDLFLVDENKWVEIKGWMRKDAQEKWDWFHQTYLNSELWDKSKLKILKII